jgi:hypothetical protein
MSITQKINELQQYVRPEGLGVLEELADVLVKHEADYIHDYLLEVLENEDPDAFVMEQIRELLDELEESLARHFQPKVEQYAAYKTDMKRFFGMSHGFWKAGRLDGINDIVSLYPHLFNPGGKTKCGRIHRKCRNPKCEHLYSSVDEIICPECDETRSLCRYKAAENGRCKRYHGGNRHDNNFAGTGRAKLYSKSLNGKLQDSYIQAVTDPEFLSVAPEIAALSARSAQVMDQLGDTDYMVVQTGIRRAVRDMRRASSDDSMHGMLVAADEIEHHLDAVAEDRRRWDEIGAISGRLGKLVETERRRIVEAQQMITVQEMYNLQQETLLKIRDAATIVAQQLHRKYADTGEVKPTQIRRIILKTLHGVISGNIKVDDYLVIDEVDTELLPEVIDGDS